MQSILLNEKGFLRNHGQRRTRHRSKSSWDTETHFVDCRNAVKWSSSNGLCGAPYRPLFRRLFSISPSVLRYDVGLSVPKRLMGASHVKEILHELESIEVWFDDERVKLSSVGKRLLEVYLKGTSNQSAHVVRIGSPMVFIETTWHKFQCISDGKTVPAYYLSTGGVHCKHFILDGGGYSAFLSAAEDDDAYKTRCLRISMARLRSTYSSVSTILNQIGTEVLPAPSLNERRLESWCKDSALILTGKGLVRSKLPATVREEYLALARSSWSLAEETMGATIETLAQRLQEVPEYISSEQLRSAVSYLLGHPAPKVPLTKELCLAILQGGVVLGDKINVTNSDNVTIVNRSIVNNALNKASEAGDEDLKKALADICAFIESLDPAIRVQAAENFEGFAEEFGKPQPRKSVLKSLWEGVLTAAPTLVSLLPEAVKIVRRMTGE